MSDLELPLEGYMVLDNSGMVMLCEYCCDRWSGRQLPDQLISTTIQFITDMLKQVQYFTPDGRVYCTDCVVGEFKPEAGRLHQVRGATRAHCQRLQREVCAMLHQACVEPGEIEFVRSLPNAPKKLVGPTGLSDNDFSLVALGAQLAARGNRVYVLSNDQDLGDFITWMRTQAAARAHWAGVGMLQGLMALTYLEMVHRTCRIETDLMHDLIQFALADHYQRAPLVGTPKGISITQRLLEVSGSLVQSVKVKQAHKGAPA